MTDLQLKFRHVEGDLGPFSFHDSQLVSQVKERIVAEWPKDGPMAKEVPSFGTDIKLILSGKFIDAAKPLKEYRKEMGEITPETIVILHVVVRPSAAPGKKAQGAASGGAPTTDQEQAKGCGCVIC